MRLKSYAAQTHQGPYLQVNEDGYDFDFENDLFMVFDGFGGSGVGDKAVSQLKSEIKSFYGQLSDDPNATMPLYYNPRNLLEGNALLNAMMNAHFNLLKANSEKPVNLRAGASTITAVKADSILILVGIGNCSAYLFRQGHLQKVISEETMESLTRESSHQKFALAPLNALGLYPEMGQQMKEIRLMEGDQILLLTDGIHAHVTAEEISFSLMKYSTSGQDKLNSLLKLSNTRGNTDNQTSMILEF